MNPEQIAETLWEHYGVEEDYSSMNKREFGELIKEAIELYEESHREQYAPEVE